MKNRSIENILLISDMDGTLLDSNSAISEQNSSAISRFVKAGGLFTVATGRMEHAVRKYLDVLPINVPAILYNGALIYDFKREKALWSNCLPDNFAQFVSDIVKTFPGIGVSIFHDGKVYNPASNIETQKHAKREWFTPIETNAENVPQPWYKIILAWEPEKLKTVEEYLKKRPESFHMVYSEPQFLEILHKNTSKGLALHKLLEILNIPELYIIALGDNMNDAEMIKAADEGIAVENAADGLKELADSCSTSNNSHAVAHVINMLEQGVIG